MRFILILSLTLSLTLAVAANAGPEKEKEKEAGQWMAKVVSTLTVLNDQVALIRQQAEDLRKDVDVIKSTIQTLTGDYIQRQGTLPKDVAAALLAANDQSQALAGAIGGILNMTPRPGVVDT